MAERGEGGDKDPDMAALLYVQGCVGGSNDACFRVATMYRDGEGIPADLLAAAAHFESACGRDHAPSCLELGIMHYEGQGVKGDAAYGAALMHAACEGGVGIACRNLSVIHRQGKHVPGDMNMARTYMARACAFGEMRSCYDAAVDLWNTHGEGEPLKEAKRLFARACEGGFTPACQQEAAVSQRLKALDYPRIPARVVARKGDHITMKTRADARPSVGHKGEIFQSVVQQGKRGWLLVANVEISAVKGARITARILKQHHQDFAALPSGKHLATGASVIMRWQQIP